MISGKISFADGKIEIVPHEGTKAAEGLVTVLWCFGIDQSPEADFPVTFDENELTRRSRERLLATSKKVE
jgi:hypothetical protein